MVSNKVWLVLVIGIVVSLASSAHAFDAPTNAKFEVTGSGNVNTHTGDMSLSIPLMTLPGKGMNFPISLGYASGVKYNQKSGVVGLGWDINIPMIQRTVSGIPDDYKASDNNNFWVYDKVSGYTEYQTQSIEVKKDYFEIGMSIASQVLQFGFPMPTSGHPYPTTAAAKKAQADAERASARDVSPALFLSAVNTMFAVSAYEGQKIMIYNTEIDTIPDDYGEPHKQQGFYYIGTGLQNVDDWQELFDFTAPDSFSITSPAYSGPMVYGENPDLGQSQPKVFHAQVASSNIHDILDDTSSACDNDNQDAICSDALQIIAYQEQTAGEYNGLIKKFKITDIDGSEYVFEPIAKMVPDGSTSVLQSEGKIYGQTAPANFAQFSQKTKAPFQGANLETDCNFGENGNYMEIMLLQPFYIEWGIKEINPAKGSGFNKLKFYYGYNGLDDWGPTYADSPSRARRCVINPDGTTSYSETYSKFQLLKYIDSDTTVNTVETPIYRLHFIYDKTTRKDQREIRSGTDRMPYLTKIVLTRGNVAYRENGAYTTDEILEQVVFDYNYTLASGTPDNLDSAPNNGRLTLKSVQTFGKGGIVNTPKTTFEYYQQPAGIVVLPEGYWGDVGGVELLAENKWYKYENGDLANVGVVTESNYVYSGQMGAKIVDGVEVDSVSVPQDMCNGYNNRGLKCENSAASGYCAALGYSSYVTGTKVCDGVAHDFGNWANSPSDPLHDYCGASGSNQWIQTMQCQKDNSAGILQLVDGVAGYNSVQLKFKAKKISGSGILNAYIKYYDSSKTYLGYDTTQQFTITNSWQTYQLSGTATAGASYAVVLIYSVAANVNDVAIDEVEFKINGGSNVLGYPGFEYPPYNPDSFDRWNDYYEGGAPFNHNAEGNSVGVKPWINSLKKVNWPTGGTIEWLYEADRYVHVGNYYASQVGNQIEKDDTHYGGGSRVSEVKKCDGLENCYSTKYVYTNDINDLVDGEQDYIGVIGGPGESSGVAVYEPPAYDGIDDSNFMTMGTPYANAYVGYENVFEINGYNENGATLEEKAPYGWTKYTYTSARTNPDLGYYEPSIVFQHPDQPDRKYGLSFKRSHDIDYGGDTNYPQAIKRSDKYTVLPVGEPVIVYGPPGAYLKFVFKLGYETNPRTYVVGQGWIGDDDYVDTICSKNVLMPYSNDCNLDPSLGMSCVQVTFEDCSIEDWGNNIALTVASQMRCGTCTDQYPGDCQLCGVVYDESVNPNPGSALLYKFVWPRYAKISCNDYGDGYGKKDCRLGSGAAHDIYDAFYRYSSYDAGTSMNLYSFPNQNTQLPAFEIYRPPEYKSLKCLDGDADGVCDYFQAGVQTQQMYSGTQNMDYLRGSLTNTETYNSDGTLVSSSENSYQYGRAFMQAYSNDGFSLPPIYWNVITETTKNIDNTQTTTLYDYNNVNGQVNYKETHNNDDILLEKTKFGGLNNMPHLQDYGAEHLYRDMRWDHSWNNVILNTIEDGSTTPSTVLTKSMVQWQMQGNAFYPKVAFLGGNFVEGSGNEMIKVSQEKYNDYGQLRVKKDYIKSSFNFDQLLTDTSSASYKYTLYGYGDNDAPCGGVPHEQNYGWQGGNDFGNFYLTCVYGCKDIVNGPETEDYTCHDWQKSTAFYNNMGQIISITDSNNQFSNYSYDNLWRLEKSYQPGDSYSGTPTTIYEYSYALDDGDGLNYDNTLANMDMNKIRSLTKINPEMSADASSYSDGLARDRLSSINDMDDSKIITETKYSDYIGLPWQVSNPRKSGETELWAVSLYEKSPLTRIEKAYALGEYSGGAFAQSFYSGVPNYHATTVVDEKGVASVSYSDKLDNVIETDTNNYVINPSFEMVTAANDPEFWECTAAYYVTTGGRYGSKALRLDTAGDDVCFGKERIPINNINTDFTVCGDFKKLQSGTARAYLGIEGYDENGNRITECYVYSSPLSAYDPPYNNWERKCATVNLNSKTTQCANARYVGSRLYNNWNNNVDVVSDGIQLYKGAQNTASNQFVSVLTQYDILGRPTKVTNALGQDTEYVYDSLSHVRAVQNPDFGVRRNLKYDARGNVLVSGDDCSWSAEYSGNPSSYSCSRLIDYGYDALNRLWCINYDLTGTESDDWTGSDCTNAETIYYYDEYSATHCSGSTACNDKYSCPKGKLTAVVDSYDKAEGDEYKSCYYYDNRGQLRKEIRTVSGTDSTLYYVYDNAGNLIEIKYPNNDLVKYDYDSVSRLRGVYLNTEAYNPSFDYDYDGTSWIDNWINGWWCRGAGTYSLETSDVRYGKYSLSHRSTATNQYCLSSLFPIDTSATSYTVCADFKRKTGSGTKTYLQVYFADENGGEIQYYTVNGFPKDNVPTQWTRYCGTYSGAIPPNAKYVRIRFFNNYNNGGGTADVLSDGFAIYPGTGEKEFSSVSYNYETDSMLAEKIYGNKVTTSYDYLPRNWVQSILSEIPGSSRTISENYNYDDAGNLIELFESDNTNQKKTGFIYDNLYRLKEAYPIDLGLGFESKGGRYKDLMNYTYDPVGNMLKSNGISMITESTSNKLNHAEIPGVGTTDYTYDNYGNLKTKSGWQEIEYASIRSVGGPPPEHAQQAELIFKGSDKKESNENEKIVSFEGTASSAAGEGTFYFYEGGEPYRLEIYGIDAKPGDTIKIVHTATEIPYTYNEYPFRGTYVWQTTVEEYTGVLGPYCDSGSSGEFTTTCDPKDKYKTFARIGGGYGQLISGSPPNAIYEDDPKIPQYFHVYEDKTTNYCFDYANRLTHWWETVNSETRNCMVFEYDNTGSRIEKTEIKEYEGNALLFNGQNNYVYIGDSFNSLVIPFTIEAWVNTAGSTQFKPIFVSDDNPSDTGNVYGIYFQIDSQNKLEITYASGTGSGSSGRRTKTSNNAIPLNQWVHIAAVVVSDGSSPVIRLYVNGNEVAGTASGTGGNLAHNSYVAVIGKKTRYSGYFNGKIDDVRIWNDVRTIDEIKQNMNIELESGDNLVAYWKMNEGQGTSIEDSAGTSDGSLRNGVVWSTRHQKIGYTTYYITQGGSTIYEKYYKLPDFTCPSSCDYGGQQLLQPPPGQEISSVQQKTTAPSNDLNSAIQKAGAAIGKFLSPFVG